MLETDHASPYGSAFDRNPTTRLPVLRGFVQVGIDSYGVVRGSAPYNPATSPPAPAIARLTGGGGKGGGRLWPILFAGIVLQDAGMMHPPRWTQGDASADPAMTFKEDWMFHRAPRASAVNAYPLQNDWQGSFWRWRGSDADSPHQHVSPFPVSFLPRNNSGIPEPNYPTSGNVTLPPTSGIWGPLGCIDYPPGTATYPNGQLWSTLEAREEQYRYSSSGAFVGIALAVRAMPVPAALGGNAFDLWNNGKDWPDRDGLVGYTDRWMTPQSRQAMVVLDYLSNNGPCQLFRSHRPFSQEIPINSGNWVPPLPAPPFRNDVQTVGVTFGIDYRDAPFAARMYHAHRWELNRAGFTTRPSGYRPGLNVEGTACVVGGTPKPLCDETCPTGVRKPLLWCQDRLAMEIQRDSVGNPVLVGGNPQLVPPTLNFEMFDMPPGAPLVAYVGGFPGTLTVPLANVPVLYVDPSSAVTLIAVVNEFGYCNLPLTLPSPGAPFTFVVQALGMLLATEYNGPPNYNYYGAATNALELIW